MRDLVGVRAGLWGYAQVGWRMCRLEGYAQIGYGMRKLAGVTHHTLGHQPAIAFGKINSNRRKANAKTVNAHVVPPGCLLFSFYFSVP